MTFAFGVTGTFRFVLLEFGVTDAFFPALGASSALGPALGAAGALGPALGAIVGAGTLAFALS